jgi:hypothetical protein
MISLTGRGNAACVDYRASVKGPTLQTTCLICHSKGKVGYGWVAEEGNDATDEEKHESNGFIGDNGLGVLFHTCVGRFVKIQFVFSPLMPVSNFFSCSMVGVLFKAMMCSTTTWFNAKLFFSKTVMQRPASH